MSSRGALVIALVVLLVGLVLAMVLGTPWRPLHVVGPVVPVDPTRDFTAAEIAREDAFHAAVRPPAYLSLVLALAVSLLLGLSPLGARLIDRVASPFGSGWGWRVLLGGVAVTAVGRLLALPLDAWAEAVQRRYGLSTQSWASWLVDVAKGYGLTLVITLVVLFGLFGLVRRAPDWWWAWAAVGGALLVVVVSFAYPVVVEPVFNKFTPLQAGPLRTSLLEMAARDGVPAKDVLVADASRRTTALNAYVSGFGATRRIVVYDTLLRSATPDEVRVVVAHELGHAKRRDVLWGTLEGALGTAVFVCLLALVLRSPGLLRRAGVESAGDPRALALVLAVIALGLVLGTPAQNLVSRRIETRADVHALDLTRDPGTFIEMEQRLSLVNLSDLDPSPIVFGLFATHPTGPQRIALARDWAVLHGLPVPGAAAH
ncbi:MAG: endopeptidase [Actinomycetota bacterium]|nr:endopeptidase [Actinomycetota bacterium]